MSFLRLLRYEKYSCSARCKNGGEIKQFHLKQSRRIIVFCKLGNFFQQTNNLLSQRWDSLRVTISLKQTHHSFFSSLQSKVRWLKRIQGAGCFSQEASDFVSVARKQYCMKCSDVSPKKVADYETFSIESPIYDLHNQTHPAAKRLANFVVIIVGLDACRQVRSDSSRL